MSASEPADESAPEWTEYEYAMHDAIREQTKQIKLQNSTLGEIRKHVAFIYGVVAVLVFLWVLGIVFGIVLAMLSASSST